MSVFIGCIVVFVTLLISSIGFPQITGSVYCIIMKKETRYLLTIILWLIILALYYLAIVNWFNNYFNCYLYPTIIIAVISLFSNKEE